MSDQLKIDIDVSSAKAALDALKSGFQTFATGAEQATGKAASAVKRLNDAMSGLKALDATKTVDSLTRLNQAMQSIGAASGLKGLAAELRSLATLDVSRLESQLRQIGVALRSIQPPAGLAATVSQLRSLGSAASSVTGQVNTAAGSIRNLGSASSSAHGGLGTLSGGFGTLRGSLGTLAAGFGLVLGGAGIGGFIKTSMDAASSVNSFNAALTSITGSSGTAKDALGWVDKEANRLAVDLTSAREGFKNYASSALSAGQNLDQVKQTFSGVSTAARVLNLSADDTSGIFRALGQIASKGVVQMEELRGQIGDRLPGAMSAFSRALGVSEKQMMEMVKAGKVGADVLPKFGEELARTFGPGLAQALNTPEAQLQRLSNTITSVAGKFGTAFFTPLKDGFKAISDALSSDRVVGAITAIGSALGNLATGFAAGFAGVFDVVGRVSEALGNAYNNVVKYLQEWNLLSDSFTRASNTGNTTAETLRVVGMMIAGLAIAGTIAAGVSLLAGAFNTAALASTALARGIAAIMISGGPITLILTALAAVGIVAAAKLGLFEKAIDQVKKVLPDTNTVMQQFTGSTDELKQKMQATVDKTEDFTKAQDKLSKGFETVKENVTQLPGPMGQFQSVVNTLSDPMSKVADAAGKLAVMLESLKVDIPVAATGLTQLTEAARTSIEPLGLLNTALGTMTPLMSQLSTTTPAFAGALTGMIVPDLTQFSASITTIASQAEGVDALQTAMGALVDHLNGAAADIANAAAQVNALGTAGFNVRDGFGAASGASDGFISALARVESAVSNLINRMGELQRAAEAALKAAQQAQSSSSMQTQSGRYGGLSTSLPETLTAPVRAFNSAPQFAEGTANTSRHLSKLPGGGIPSILHPNEAVVPLSRGRKIPVDVNLSMSAPAPTQSIDLQPTARALESVATSQSDLADALASRTADVPAYIAERQRVMTEAPTASFGVGGRRFTGIVSRQGAGGGGGSTAADTSTSTSASTGNSGVTVVISPGAIQVNASDLDGFKRSEDQIVRDLASKIQRAVRRIN